MSTPPSGKSLLLLATWALLAALVAGACGGSSPGPAATPTADLLATPSPTSDAVAPTLEPVPGVSLGDRVTFYGRDRDDAAMGLAAGDFNGDSVADVVLTAPLADGPENARPDAGEALIFFGPFTPGEARDAAEGGQDVTIFGAGADDRLGQAVAADDVNGDGLDDIALGAPLADGPGDERPEAGETYVLFGARSWPEAVDLATDAATAVVFGGDEGDLAGFTLATPDADGDGVHDLLIGAFWADGPDNSRPEAGEAYLVFGSPSWPSTIDLAAEGQDVTVSGAEAGDWLSEGMATGDTDGDGVDDLVLAATFGSGPENRRDRAGEVYVIPGGDLEAAYDLARSEPRLTVLGRDEGDQIGHSAAVGDVDGDGLGDLLLGAVSADGPNNDRDLAGEAYLVLSSASQTGTVDTLAGGETLRIHGADAVDRLGRSVATGDLNGDGRDDLLLAAPRGDGAEGSLEDAGEIYVLYGRPGLRGALDLAGAQADLVIEGLDAEDTLATSTFTKPPLLSADMDGDGLDDVLVSALGDGPGNDRPDAGEAYILFARR